MTVRGADTFYGIDSWLVWDEQRPDDLSSTKTTGAHVHRAPPFEVSEYVQLVGLVSFLNVMNKSHHLLFRGQAGDWPLLPSLLRDTWTPPPETRIDPVALLEHRVHYLEQLDRVRDHVVDILAREKRLPRWRPFQYKRVAAWAVVQHYELWPTPLLDLTSSLRIAASFALGLENRDWPGSSTGILYVLAIPELRDFMDLDEDSSEMQALRLNSVCPPDAVRPHFQEGFLLTRPNGGHKGEELVSGEVAIDGLVAKFRLLDEGGFWTSDFPRHSRTSLLPEVDHDPLLREFREHITYQMDRERLFVG